MEKNLSMENIRKFEDFLSKESPNKIQEDLMSDFFGSAFDAFGGLSKETFAKYACSYLGISEDSLLGKVIANVFEQFSISEWIDLFTEGKIPGELPEKMAGATIEVLADLGISGVADKLGIEKRIKTNASDRKEMFGLFNITGTDQDGLLYRMFSEMIQNKAAQGGELKSMLTNFYSYLFGMISKNI